VTSFNSASRTVASALPTFTSDAAWWPSASWEVDTACSSPWCGTRTSLTQTGSGHR
jgi:hypothetical protein